MSKWIAGAVLLFILIIGFVKVVIDWKKNRDKQNFTATFLNKFREFGADLLKNEFNQEHYQWLKMKSYKMQSLSGDFGIAQSYKPAGANYFFKNYQIVINGITEVKDIYQRMNGSFGGLSIEWDMLRQAIGMIDDVLLSYFGFLENKSEYKTSSLKNPLIWLREGVQFIVTFPILLTYWSGIINYRIYDRFTSNILVKLFSLAIGIIAFISSVITIVTGYMPFLDYIKNFLK